MDLKSLTYEDERGQNNIDTRQTSRENLPIYVVAQISEYLNCHAIVFHPNVRTAAKSYKKESALYEILKRLSKYTSKQNKLIFS